MKILVTFTAHAVESDGKFYNRSKALVNYTHLCRYRRNNNNVVVVLRCQNGVPIQAEWPRIDGEGVTVAPIPDPASPIKALIYLPSIVKAIVKAIRSCDRYLLKLPEPTATITGLVLWMMRRKYAVEVVADAAKGILYAKKNMPLVQFYAWLFDCLTKFLVHRASCATYVSRYLRDRYPTRCPSKEWIFCSIELDSCSIGLPRTVEFFRTEPFIIIAVGRMSAEKGHVYLVRALKEICLISQKPIELHFVGDGPERSCLEFEAQTLGIREKIIFHGYVKRGPELFALLDHSHLFVMPSLTEGMGRGLIEAMARGIPCIGSSVGGIPEYLDTNALFAPQDPMAIAKKIISLLNDPETLAAVSQRNFNRAKAFWPDADQKKDKDQFWLCLEQKNYLEI